MQQLHIEVRLIKFVIANQQPERLATILAVFFLVNLLEQGALVKLRGFFEVLVLFFLADVEYANLETIAGLALVDQIM